MGFDSIFFISCFLPAALLLYWLIPGRRGKNIALLCMGLVFYAFGSIAALGLLVAAALGNYLLGLLLQKQKSPKAVVIFGVAANLLYLGAFKYLHFFLADLLGLPVQLGLAAPLGMSFFIFKGISYLVDTYRRPDSGTDSFFQVLLYLSFFPQVTAGPITRFDRFSAQLTQRQQDLRTTAEGIRRFLVGLSKKVLLCSALAAAADRVFALNVADLDVRLAWLGAVAYTLQIYFDFSGYSDMAIGLGQAMGFVTPENFRHPYAAVTVGDFWRRWHISLSQWFRDYLYIPLGGNRKGKWRTALNKMIVFALCGLWHGAAWTFLVWGLWHGLFSALESLKVIRPGRTAAGRLAGRVYTLLVVCLGFVMFRAGTVTQGMQIIGAMFTGFSFTAAGTAALYGICSAQTLCALVGGAVLSAPILEHCSQKLRAVTEPLSYAGCLILFALCLMKLAAGGFVPFIYAQF